MAKKIIFDIWCWFQGFPDKDDAVVINVSAGLRSHNLTVWELENRKFLTIDINDEKRFRKAGVQGPESGGWNYPDGLFVGKGGT